MPGKILVLDDEENYAEMLQELLAEHRFLADMATKPEEALKALHEKNYDLIISDYKMPVMDGADLLQQARAYNPKLPVILVSGLMNTPELVKVANMGVTLVMEKPLDVDLFIQHVKRFVDPLSDEEMAKLQGQSAASSSVTYTYPSPLQYLSDCSEPTHRLIQQLWNAVKSRRFLALATHPGAERQAIVDQLAEWRGQSGREHLHYTVNGLFGEGAERNLAALKNHPTASRTIIISGFGEVQAHVIQRLTDWVHASGKEAPHEDEISILAFLNYPDEVDNIERLAPDLAAKLFRRLIVFPPLNDRLADLADYARRYLAALAAEAQSPDKAKLSPDAVALLLNHDWENDHTGLQEVLYRVFSSVSQGPIQAMDLAQAINRDMDHVSPIPGLEHFLTRKQHAIIRQAKRASGDDSLRWTQVLQIDPDQLTNVEKPEEQPLIFADLLRAGG